MPESAIFYKVLGIDRNATSEAIRKAYHEKVRQCHPDLQQNRDSEQCHLRMVRVNQAYCQLMKVRKGRGGIDSAGQKGSGDPVPNDPHALVPHKDPAYSYYKRGYRLFTKIHPSSWFWSNGPDGSTRFPRKIDTASMARSIERIIDLIPWAYHYFNVVVDEYPGSHWYLDSRYKIRKIEKLAPIYMKILYSYRKKWRVAQK